jgi:hypothetical protein
VATLSTIQLHPTIFMLVTEWIMANENKKTRWARLQYAKNLEIYQYEKPYSILTAFEDCDETTNLEWEQAEPEVITNVRGIADRFTLDDHGFAYVKWPTLFHLWDSRQAVEEIYLPEVETLLKESIPGVDEVVVFDWRVRSHFLVISSKLTTSFT